LPQTPSEFESTSEEAVKEELRQGYWPVYEHYCVVSQGGVASCTGVEDPDVLRELNEQLHEPAKAPHGDYLEAPSFVRGRSSELDRLGIGEFD